MTSSTDLRSRRTAARIPGQILCAKAQITRSRLSEIERGYVQASPAEIDRLSKALDELIEAQQRIAQIAAQCGWPVPV